MLSYLELSKQSLYAMKELEYSYHHIIIYLAETKISSLISEN